MWNHLPNAAVDVPAPSRAGPFSCWPWWQWSCGPLSPRSCTRCWAKIPSCVKLWTWYECRIDARLSGACQPPCPRPKRKCRRWPAKSWPQWLQALMSRRLRPVMGGCIKRRVLSGMPATESRAGCQPACATWIPTRPGPRVAIVGGCKAIAWSCKGWSLPCRSRSLPAGAPTRWGRVQSWHTPWRLRPCPSLNFCWGIRPLGALTWWRPMRSKAAGCSRPNSCLSIPPRGNMTSMRIGMRPSSCSFSASSKPVTSKPALPKGWRVVALLSSPAYGSIKPSSYSTITTTNRSLTSRSSLMKLAGESPPELRAGFGLSGLEKLTESPSLVRLRDAVKARLPRVDLPEILLEIAAHTGFTTKFTHVSERESRVGDLATSLCAVLLAEACNIGLEPLVRNDVPALRRARLAWTNQNFIRTDTLTEANACLVALPNPLPRVQAWG